MTSHIGANGLLQGAPNTASALSQTNLQSQNSRLDEAATVPSVTAEGSDVHRAESSMSQSQTLLPSRGGTLKKRQSMIRRNSMRRSVSKMTSRASSITSIEPAEVSQRANAFYTPVPTQGTPTDSLARRFEVWRKVLKDLITYFRDIQKAYENRSKALYSLSSVITSITPPSDLLKQGGISDAVTILRDYQKKAISQANRAKSIEEEILGQLTGLRSDLGQKIKEIKGVSGDFKNNVDREIEGTRRAVRDLEEALEERNPDTKNDPYLVKLAVERQLRRQIEEENYLHRAFLNLESSGRELEAIVVGEIQKAYTAYAGIMKREADEAYEAIENLQNGPLALPKDTEWKAFVGSNDQFVDPELPVRRVNSISYPGKDDPAASEVKAGMLERKSKYLKSYTPGWYVLSPTHIHEFKSPDRISSQTPVMSLPLADQKLGSHSSPDSTSHKFMLKGRQSGGGMHKSHAWVFRAESYDTMMAWFNDIKTLTETSGAVREAFLRRNHARSIGGASLKTQSVSDASALDEDEADRVPYSAATPQIESAKEKLPQRPGPGGRIPSLLSIHQDSQVALVSSSASENTDQRKLISTVQTTQGHAMTPDPMKVRHDKAVETSSSHVGQDNYPPPVIKITSPANEPHV